jgi:HD-GYP domain-containing protein (c-di-GMP phosphodiesterase class II)
VLDAEPAPVLRLDAVDLDEALHAVADFADMRSRWFLGRSAGVSALVNRAAAALGASDEQRRALRRAALVHDIGRVGAPSGIWDHPGPLTGEQWERVRLHPYLSERVLGRCDLLAVYGPSASRHHERGDGSGYHRGLTSDELGDGDQLLAAADSYHAMTERRPHRPPLAPSQAADELRAEVVAGRLRRKAVDAVLAAAGHASRPVSVPRPADLTEREVDVLRLLARGHTNRAIASELAISPKTVSHHVEHIYAKAGVKTRAGATLFAVEAGLITP